LRGEAETRVRDGSDFIRPDQENLPRSAVSYAVLQKIEDYYIVNIILMNIIIMHHVLTEDYTWRPGPVGKSR
jgi:hypothetical protein